MTDRRYSGISITRPKDESLAHLGGNAIQGDPYTFCPSVWKYVVDRFAVESCLDYGSGYGFSSSYLAGMGVRVVAADGLPENVRNARYPTILHDVTHSPLITDVDLVHCQEVLEHVSDGFLPNMLNTLKSGRFILVTHALPDQTGGHHHVNLRTSDYWISQMESVGCVLLEEDTKRVRRCAELDGAVYMQRSGMIFHNTQKG